MKSFALQTAILATLAWPAPGWAEQVTLRIDNVRSDDEGSELTRALARVPDVKVAERITKDKPTTVIAFDPAKCDLGDLAQAVAQFKTCNRDKPAAVLVLKYKRIDGGAAADDVYLPPIVEKALGKLKGVEAKESKLDAKNKQLLIKLDGKGGAKLADIKAAFPGLALE